MRTPPRSSNYGCHSDSAVCLRSIESYKANLCRPSRHTLPRRGGLETGLASYLPRCKYLPNLLWREKQWSHCATRSPNQSGGTLRRWRLDALSRLQLLPHLCKLGNFISQDGGCRLYDKLLYDRSRVNPLAPSRTFTLNTTSSLLNNRGHMPCWVSILLQRIV